MANKIGTRGQVLNHVLGYIRDGITIPRGLPMINAIVVEKHYTSAW